MSELRNPTDQGSLRGTGALFLPQKGGSGGGVLQRKSRGSRGSMDWQMDIHLLEAARGRGKLGIWRSLVMVEVRGIYVDAALDGSRGWRGSRGFLYCYYSIYLFYYLSRSFYGVILNKSIYSL